MQILDLEVREQLFDMYVNKKLSTYEIARKLIKTERTICRWINVYGIPKREKAKLDNPVLKNKQWLLEMYVEQKKSTREIGHIINVSDETVRKALIMYDIPRRKRTKKVIEKKKIDKKHIRVINHQHGTWYAMM